MEDNREMSFIDHLEELRWHLIRALLSIFVFSLVAFWAKEFVFHGLILGPSRVDFWTYQMFCQLSDLTCISTLPFSIQSRTMTGQFTMHIAASLGVGLICAFPYSFWELWRFIKPALYTQEQQKARGATFFVTLLFMMGILFGYYLITPLSINFLANYQVDPAIINEFDITSYVSTVLMLTLSCGIMFQLPMIVYFLSEVGILTPLMMRYFRRHAVVVILFIAAVITPPDVISQCLVGLPVYFLYEVSIFISEYVQKKNLKRLQQAQTLTEQEV